VRSLVQYAQVRGLDGVNLDTEDSLPSNHATLTLLIAEVRAAFLKDCIDSMWRQFMMRVSLLVVPPGPFQALSAATL
jgi:hypothetical protein